MSRITWVLLLTLFGCCLSCENAGCSVGQDNCRTSLATRWTPAGIRVNNKRYYFGIFSKLNWFKASEFCRYHGMDLATFSTQEENNAVVNHISKLGHNKSVFWIAGNDLGQEGYFVWSSTGEPFTYTNWGPYDPNNYVHPTGDEDCVQLWREYNDVFSWADGLCSWEHYFICEMNYC